MKFKLVIIFFCFWTFDSWAQRCGGELYFRIYDKKENKIYPSTGDTLKMNIDVNAIDIGVGRYIDGKKLPVTKLSIRTIKTDGNAGTASLNLVKFPFTNILVRFSTGCFTQLKKISLIKGKEKMTLNLVDIPREVTILMDSIPFVEGEVTYNIEKIVRDNKVCSYENLPNDKFYLNYLISPKTYSNSYSDSINLNFQVKIFPYANGVIRFNGQPAIIRDTSFYYFDYENKKLFCKGRLERYRTKCRKLSFESKQFIDNKKDYYKTACTKLYKIGNWIFYDEKGNILLSCNYIKHRRTTVPNGVWKYCKDNKIYKIEKYNRGKLQLTSYDPKDF